MITNPENKLAGILAPLFALRSSHDLGIGDVGALREFVSWAAEYGYKVVQLLPINETGADNSPYNAISAVALDPLTIETLPGALPGLSKAEFDEITADFPVADLRTGIVQYATVRKLKQALLQRAWQNCRASRSGPPPVEGDWLRPYKVFRALAELHGTEIWTQWPLAQQTLEGAIEEMESGALESKKFQLLARMDFFQFVQDVAWHQWRTVRAYAEEQGVALMGDIPFGVSYYSADVWTRRDLFDHEWCGGCPPEKVFEADPFTTKWGQNWGIPLYRWDAHRAENYAWWRERTEKVREVFHYFRIDHILGFFRIYSFPWRPQRNEEFLPLTEEEAKERTGGHLPGWYPRPDDTAENQRLNHDQGEEVLKALLEVAGEFRLIGEDLGVVPDYVRPCLTSLGIAGFKIPYWENRHDGSMVPGEEYPRLSVATFATHDFEPMATMWDGFMKIIQQAETGDESVFAARDRVWHEASRVAAWSGFRLEKIMWYDDAIREAILRTLFKSNTWMALIMITDLLGLRQRFNQPGSVADSNWTQRLAHTVDEWRADGAVCTIMIRLRDLIKSAGR